MWNAHRLSLFSLFGLSLITAIGTYWAFGRGANDFGVFYHAWNLAGSGHGDQVYLSSPDRFLYAPGFAWIFAPLSWLPKAVSLAVWCFAKAAALGGMVRIAASYLEKTKGIDRSESIGISAAGGLILSKPILIDLQYGQVNLLITAACAWAMFSHFSKGSSPKRVASAWFCLGIAAIAKIFPLPLLLVPWLRDKGVLKKQILIERWASIAAVLSVLFIPIPWVGFEGAFQLMQQWKGALIARGFPLESHNQSFAAFIHHYLSGESTHVIAQAAETYLGTQWFGSAVLNLLSTAWAFITAGVLLAVLFFSKLKPSRWTAISIGLLIVPLYLIWKPYFVLGLPAAFIAMGDSIIDLKSNRYFRMSLLILLAAFVNFTGFDFLGPDWGARAEAASVLLFAHLGLLLMVALPS